MARHIVSFARYRDLLVENSKIFIPCVYLAHSRCDPIRILERCLILIKLEWLGYLVVKKLWQLSYFNRIMVGLHDRQTDGQTDSIAISISCVELLTRYKNAIITTTNFIHRTFQWHVNTTMIRPYKDGLHNYRIEPNASPLHSNAVILGN